MKSPKVFVEFLGIAFYYKILKYAFFSLLSNALIPRNPLTYSAGLIPSPEWHLHRESWGDQGEDLD